MSRYVGGIHSDTRVMPREIGDYEFNRMFPDQNKPAPPLRPPSLLDRLVDRFFNPVQSTVDQSAAARDGYEYLTVKVPPARGAKSDQRRHTRALNKYAAEGWELVESQPKGVLEWGRKDTVTFRRPRS